MLDMKQTIAKNITWIKCDSVALTAIYDIMFVFEVFSEFQGCILNPHPPWVYIQIFWQLLSENGTSKGIPPVLIMQV